MKGNDLQTENFRVLFLQEYDFVFTVDIDDGKPPLKLPYNKSEDPWFVAQAFIHKHDLPQSYLEEVANFIIKNSKQTNAPIAPAPPEYADPFTGEYLTFHKAHDCNHQLAVQAVAA